MCCDFTKCERHSALRSPSSMFARENSDVWLQEDNIETGGGREDGTNISRNGVIHVNGYKN